MRSYANVAATLALIFSMAGGAYAAVKLPRNSVTSRAIKNGTIKPVDLSAKARAKTGASGAAGAAGRDGAALIVDKTLGPATIPPSATLSNVIGSFTWNQPAGTLDDIRGYISIQGVQNCAGSDKAEYQVVLDGREISSDSPNGAPDSVGVETTIDSGPSSPPNIEPLAIELPAFPTTAAADHTLEFRMRSECSVALSIPSVRFLVTRFSA